MGIVKRYLVVLLVEPENGKAYLWKDEIEAIRGSDARGHAIEVLREKIGRRDAVTDSLVRELSP